MTLASVVVVLSWHGRDDTIECVASLMLSSARHTILVIDNGSQDGTLDAVRDIWPQVETLQTGRNLGFAGGMNAGLRWALDRGAAYVTVLNNDTILPDDALDALVAAAGTRRAVSPEIYYADRPDQLWYGAGEISPETGLPHHVVPQTTDDSERLTEILAGCCITASSDVWRTVGGFDERYFLNFEDSAWSVRARALGVDLVVTPAVRIRHRVSASLDRGRGYLSTYYYARNGLLFGRETGSTWRARALFLRRHVLPSVRQRFRRDGLREGLRGATMVGCAVLDHGLRRYGPAPRSTERRVRRWLAPRDR